jgi:colanic acid/amylovoran biosynthesis protein
LKILISDCHCSSNRGDAAILEGVRSSLERVFTDPDIMVLSTYPDSVQRLNDLKAVKQPLLPFRFWDFLSNIRFIYSLLGASCLRKGRKIPAIESVLEKTGLSVYLDADLVISTGGSFINDFYAPANLGRLFDLYFAKLLGKKVALYAQSIGPLYKMPCRWIARYILNRMDIITLRDECSKKILKSIGVSNPPIVVTADAAFAMSLEEKTSIQESGKEAFDLNEVRGFKVSISLRKWLYRAAPDSHCRYLNAIAGLADWLIEEKNATVVFASTCTDFAGYNMDDRVVASEVIRRMKCKTKNTCFVLEGDYRPQELVLIMGQMDLHVGTRMHSNILAMLGGTPSVAIGYEFKTLSMMESLGLEEYVVDIKEIDRDRIKEKVAEAILNIEDIKKQLKNKLPEIISRADSTARIIKDAVNISGE